MVWSYIMCLIIKEETPIQAKLKRSLQKEKAFILKNLNYQWIGLWSSMLQLYSLHQDSRVRHKKLVGRGDIACLYFCLQLLPLTTASFVPAYLWIWGGWAPSKGHRLWLHTRSDSFNSPNSVANRTEWLEHVLVSWMSFWAIQIALGVEPMHG